MCQVSIQWEDDMSCINCIYKDSWNDHGKSSFSEDTCMRERREINFYPMVHRIFENALLNYSATEMKYTMTHMHAACLVLGERIQFFFKGTPTMVLVWTTGVFSIFPFFALDTGSRSLEDEKNILYVAVTRAKKSLQLNRAIKNYLSKVEVNSI